MTTTLDLSPGQAALTATALAQQANREAALAHRCRHRNPALARQHATQANRLREIAANIRQQ